MALALASSSFGLLHAPLAAHGRSAGVVMETKADLVKLADDLNPVVGFWDPLKLSEFNLWGQGEEATIGWIRESEIKHGRIAMFGFVGWMVHAAGIRTAGDQIVASVPAGLSAPETWDAIPEAAKFQIVTFVGVMELWRENKVVLEGEGQKHYMRGGKPGYFPSFDMVPHPVPYNLFDPFGFSKGRSEEDLARGRLIEINNGRLAMLGLMSFASAAKIPGSVPFLKGIIDPYAGDFMAPFAQSVFSANPSYTGFTGFTP